MKAMRYRTTMYVAALTSSAVAPNMALANDWSIETRVQVIETTYMPGRVVFTVDSNAGSCAAGAWLVFFARGATEAERIASTQAMLAGLMTARAANRPVRLYGFNDGCVVNYIHLL